ncbi:MAG: NAD(P)H-dependent glycerol-3-phosphate dehydrogenase [Epsilonproteobacteria bacterium]|nr:NAD(P)H-dependent glycerol-3-phosphate dehydrogenase [Campylobacterota bacterium]
MEIGVIGAGSWGYALFKAFSLQHTAYITSRHKRDIPHFVSLDEVLKCEYLLIAISTQSLHQFLSTIDITDKKILVASKGIDKTHFKFINEIYEQFTPKDNLAYIGGPSFAKEVLHNKPTALVIASHNLSLAKEFSKFFPEFIKTYIDNDVVGVEIAGAYKNVIAIASGICEGLQLGQNAKASLLARGLIEMNRFAKAFGGRDETFLGLAGAGDLFLSANSTLSRNYRVGLKLANNEQLNTILDELGEVAEGVFTAEAIYNMSRKFGIYTPIANEVYHILNGKDIKQSLEDLLSKA